MNPGKNSRSEWDSAKRACFERDEGKCRKCSRPATDCHHLKPRQMGGRKDPEVNFGLANLVSLCRECHSWIHLHPAESYEKGWLVHSWQSPSDVPLKDPVKYEF